MLGKLIKHDFKSLSRILFPTELAIIGATIIATAGIKLTMTINYNSFSDESWASLLQFLTGMISGFMILGIVVAFFFVTFVIFYRFYKNFMCSEGYLTFTLPVSTAKLLWSKLITAVLWLVISALVGFLCLFIFLLFGTDGNAFINTDVFAFFGEFFRILPHYFTGSSVFFVFEILLLVIAGTVFTLLQVYLALIIGGVVSQKHKLLAGIGFYFAINVVVGVFNAIIQFFVTGRLADTFSNVPALMPGNDAAAINQFVLLMQSWILPSLLLSLTLGVVFFIVSNYLLKNKLNLA